MNLVRKLFYLLDRRARWQALGLLPFMILGATLDAVGVGMVLPFFSLIEGEQALQKYPWLFKFYQQLEFKSYSQFLLLTACALLLFSLFKGIYLTGLYFLQASWIYGKQVQLSRRLLHSYLARPYLFFTQNNTSVLLRNLNSEIVMMFHSVLMPMLVITTDMLIVSFILGLVFWLQPSIALITSLGTAGCMGLIHLLSRSKISRLGKDYQSYSAEMLKWTTQSLTGIKEIKLHGNEKFFLDAFIHASGKYARAYRYLQTMVQFPRIFFETVAVGTILIAIMVSLVGGKQIQQLIPFFALFAMALLRILPSAVRMLSNLTTIRYYAPTVEVIAADLAKPPAPPLLISEETTQSLPFRQELLLKEVTFKYPEAPRPILENLSLSIKKGTALGIVGSSGTGKTTLVNILLGLLTPTDGDFLVDQKSISPENPLWRQKIGYLPQQVFLIDDTLRHNIALGIPDAEIDEKLLWQSLRMAQLTELVESLPDGLDTKVGENGIRFSGGQRQRIGIARALYREPEVLVLDEATSALDQETEAALHDEIIQLRGEKTLLIVSHRERMLSGCDVVYQIDNGKMVQVTV